MLSKAVRVLFPLKTSTRYRFLNTALFSHASDLCRSEEKPIVIHPSAVIHPNAVLGHGVSVGPFCTVGSSARLGNYCQLHPGSHVFGDTELGDHCILLASVALLWVQSFQGVQSLEGITVLDIMQ